MITPMVIAVMAIFIIGDDTVCLLSLLEINLRAIKYSKFNVICFIVANVKKVLKGYKFKV